MQPDDGWSWLGRGLARKNRGQKEPALADLTRECHTGTKCAERLGNARRDPREPLRAGTKRRRPTIVGRPSGAIPARFPGIITRPFASMRAISRDIVVPARTMVEHFGTTTDPFVASLVAHACSLGTDSRSGPRPRHRARRGGGPCQTSRWLVYLYARGGPAPGRPPGRGRGQARPGCSRRPGVDRQSADQRFADIDRAARF